MGLMSSNSGEDKVSWDINMSRSLTNAVTTIRFLEKGTYKVSGTYDAGWICRTTITCKGIRRGYAENQGTGRMDFTFDAVPNDTLVIDQTTDQQNAPNRYGHTHLAIVKIK